MLKIELGQLPVQSGKASCSEGLEVGLVLWGHHLESLNNTLTGDLVFPFCTGLHTLDNWF